MEIRALTDADRPALAAFSCERIGEPWSGAIQETVREDLPGQIAAGVVEAVGLFDDVGVLCGVAAWRIYDLASPVLCRGDIVAVAIGNQGRGYGRRLKAAMLEAETAAGAAAVASIVDRRNLAMLRLNETFGAHSDDIDDDPNNIRCIIGLR